MANDGFIEKLASGLGQAATVKNVFGEPIHLGDKTVVPVAKIAYGFGGGYGQGKKKSKAGEVETDRAGEAPSGEGAGGGGGLRATPCGVYEITATTTRFIPARSGKYIVIGLAFGFLLSGFLLRKR